MKKRVSVIVFAVFLLAVFPVCASADMGPKPSVVIDFTGISGETYFATLLSQEDSGPYQLYSETGGEDAMVEEGDENYGVFMKFAGYEDPEGYGFLQFFQDCSQSRQFTWGYYPPPQFKILLYFPEYDRFLVSGSYESYAFDSVYAAQVSLESGDIRVQNAYPYGNEIFAFAVRVALTVVIELLVALLFGFRGKKQIRFLILVNIATQLLLNLALQSIGYFWGQNAFLFFYFVLELAVFVIEAALYATFLPKYAAAEIPGWKPAVYAFAANAVSYFAGLGLSFLLPAVF